MSAYFFAGLAGGLVLYTYALSYLILPLFLITSFVYLQITRHFQFIKWVIMGIPMGLLAFPLLLEQYVNAFDRPEIELGLFTITKMRDYRAGEINPITWENFTNAVKNIFIGDVYLFNSVPEFMTLYGITVVLFVIGLFSCLLKLVTSIRNRSLDYLVFPLLWFFCALYVVSHISCSSVNQINSIYFTTVLIALEGALFLCRHLKKLSPRIIMLSLSAAYLLCFLRFGIYYYTGGYTAAHYLIPNSGILVPEALAFLEEHPEYANKGTYMAEHEIYYALSTLQSPYEMELYLEDNLVGDGYFICGTLPAIDTDYNYIVRNGFAEYADILRSLGYTEIQYVNYSLFYME